MERIKATSGRILSVDFGDTRTGLAISDETRFLASGIGYISPGGIVKTADEVAKIAQEQRAVAIVVGHPKNMDGSEGPRAQRAAEFAGLLGERLPELPIVLVSRPPRGNFAQEQHEQRREVIRETWRIAVENGDKKVWFVDGQTLFGDADIYDCTMDGVHPNDAGHERIYRRLKGFLQSI